ncbi:Disulfide-bond oxidoreductase YfcG [Asticcacaulis sp. MM231]|uniref:glutathione S-transferase family protein n=1 Tax=Asticcacaulis sp. MM231 TaxID=3157666 RepID=UPI0032D5A370
MTQRIKFYTFPLSGNAHRVELLLRALDVPFNRIDVNLRDKEQKTADFLAMNPFGQVPVINDNGTIIWDFVAIMTYLALTYDTTHTYLPQAPAQHAEVITWLAKTSGPIAYGPAAARRINIFKTPQDISVAQQVAHDFLNVVESHLARRDWLVGDSLTLADLACYTYIAHAPEGGIDLAGYPNILVWLERMEALPFFVAMPKSKAGLWA